MKTMLISDLLLWKDSIVRLVLLYLAIGVVFALFGENPWMAGAMVSCMFAIGSTLSGPVCDEKNDWGTGRLCLPISRKDVVIGRYASTVAFTLIAVIMGMLATGITCAIAMVAFPDGGICQLLAEGDAIPVTMLSCSFAFVLVALTAGVYYPLCFKMGNKKALRLVPVVVALLCILIFMLIEQAPVLFGGTIGNLVESEFMNTVYPVIIGSVILFVVVLAVSCALSIKFYENREL